MRRFGYVGVARLAVTFTQFSGVVVLLLCVVAAVTLFVLPFLPQAPPDVSAVGMTCFALWVLMIGLSVGFGLMNSYPTVWLEDKGLTISAFLFGRVRIAWPEIVDVGVGRVPFGHVLVRARRITPVHVIYGWLYSRSLYPSFIIRRDIEHRDELIRELRQRM